MAADKTITCRDCGTEFLFPVREQEFFAERGFGDPVRCITCRRALKAKRQGEGEGPGAPQNGQGRLAGPGAGASRPPRTDDRPPRREGGPRPYESRDYNRGARPGRGPMSESGRPEPMGDGFDEFPELRPNYRAEPVLAGGQDSGDRRDRPRPAFEDFPSRKQREKKSTRPRVQDDGAGGGDED